MTNIRLTSASKQKIPLVGVITIFVQIGDLKVRVWFGVIDELDLPAIFGTYFIENFIKSIFPAERKIVPHHYRDIAILATSVFHEGQ